MGGFYVSLLTLEDFQTAKHYALGTSIQGSSPLEFEFDVDEDIIQKMIGLDKKLTIYRKSMEGYETINHKILEGEIFD